MISIDAKQDCLDFQQKLMPNGVLYTYKRAFDTCDEDDYVIEVILESKELNHLVVILHVYVGGLIFYEVKKKCYFLKRKGKYLYTFNHFYSEN